MKEASRAWVVLAVLLTVALSVHGFGQGARALPVKVLAQSPAETKTELQIICLFQPAPGNTLQGALAETDERLHGLLGQVRRPGLFGAELGETLLLAPPAGTLGARRLLLIGLGDAAGFTSERMRLVGRIALREANRLGVAHPFFAPTVLDGGVTKYSTGEVAEQVVRGVREALAAEEALRAGGSAKPLAVEDFTFLAGAKHATDTQEGINRALGGQPGH